MISFVNFARIASICVGFHLGTLQGYFFHQDFWPNLNFLLEYQIILVLNWLHRKYRTRELAVQCLIRTCIKTRIFVFSDKSGAILYTFLKVSLFQTMEHAPAVELYLC